MASTLTTPAGSAPVADYLFYNMTDANVPDASDNGHGFAVTGTYSLSSQGLVSTSAHGDTGIASNQAVTVLAVLSFGSGVNTDIYPVLGSTTPGNYDCMWHLSTNSANPASPNRYLVPQLGYNNCSYGNSSWVFPNTPTMCGWVTPSTTANSDVYYADRTVSLAADTYQGAGPNTIRDGTLGYGYDPGTFSNHYFVGTMSRLVIFNTALTQAQVYACYDQMNLECMAKGFQLGLANSDTTPVLAITGDSISRGAGATSGGGGYENQLNLSGAMANAKIIPIAIIGIPAALNNQRFPNRHFDRLRSARSPSVFLAFNGTNDYPSPIAGVVASNQSEVTMAQAASYDATIVMPMLSRGGGAGGTYTSNDDFKNQFNSAITSLSSTSPVVKVIPVSSMPHLIPDGSYSNSYFSGDNTHPSDTGYVEIGGAIGPVLNALTFPIRATTGTLSGSSSGTSGAESALTITLDHVAPSGGIVVSLLSSVTGDTFRATSGGSAVTSVTVPAGATTVSALAVPSSTGARNLYINSSLLYITPGALGLTAASAVSSLNPGTVAVSGTTPTTANLTATNASGGTSPYAYQWYRSTTSGFTPASGNLISGATSLALNDTGLVASTHYYYVIKYTDSASATSLSPQATAITAASPSTPIVPGSVTGAASGSATVSVAPSGGNGVFTYQWYKSTSSGSQGIAIAGATSASLTATGLTLGTQYYFVCVVGDSASDTPVSSAQYPVTVGGAGGGPVFSPLGSALIRG